MDVRYRTRQLERCAYDADTAARRWGAEVAARYPDRIAMIRSVSSLRALSAIQALRVHPLKGPHKGLWSLTLTGRWRLIFSPTPEGVIIEEVTNHYGN